VVETPAAPTEPVPAPFTLPFPPLIDPGAGISLRPWGSGSRDAEALLGAWRDPDVARWNKLPPDTSEQNAHRWVHGEERRRERGTSLDLVIAELANSDRVLGEVGFVLVEAERRWAEVGYWLAADARGKGVASQALALFAEWALREQPVRRLFARCDPANPTSAAVVERAGFTLGGVLDDGPQVWVRDG
jgi:RimJ/RimL family protein N-acetyltransferase